MVTFPLLRLSVMSESRADDTLPKLMLDNQGRSNLRTWQILGGKKPNVKISDAKQQGKVSRSINRSQSLLRTYAPPPILSSALVGRRPNSAAGENESNTERQREADIFNSSA